MNFPLPCTHDRRHDVLFPPQLLRSLFGFLLFAVPQLSLGQSLPLLKANPAGTHLITEDGQPFFWLGGTAWELLHRLTKEEITYYLEDRASKGFTVIQTVVLAEADGLNTPNAYGHTPLIDNDPTQLDEGYFEVVDFTLREAQRLGLYVGLLPTWGDKFNKAWGVGPEIFTPENAFAYGKLLAKRYQKFSNLIWILGGDRLAETDTHKAIIRQMAAGIRSVSKKQLLTFHPKGGYAATQTFNESWLDFDMFQSGHSRDAKEYGYVQRAKQASPTRPIINGEPRYENIQNRFWEEGPHVWLDDADVRIAAYYSLLAGAAGYTYGCNDIWQMYASGRNPTLQARTDWHEAVHLPGSRHMKHLRSLFESLPWQELQYAPEAILNENPEDEAYQVCAKGEDVLVAYTPKGTPLTLAVRLLNALSVKAYWYTPRSGVSTYIGTFSAKGPETYPPWSEGWGSDFVLVVMAEEAEYQLPGME